MNSSFVASLLGTSQRQRHHMQCLFYSVAHAEAPNHTWAEDAPAAGIMWC